MPVLTGIDVVGIQRFVFGSNRLRDVVGASSLVEWATSKSDALSSVPAEDILLAAGGNAILRFNGENALDNCRSFSARFTRDLFDKAPGVEIVIAHRPFHDGEIARALRALQVDLAREKLERRPDIPLLGLSVTASCGHTGLPAVGFDSRERGTPLSRQALALCDPELRRAAAQRWEKFIPIDQPNSRQFEFTDELNELGASSGERSLLGVVHVDGNGIGRRIRTWLEQCINDGADDAAVLSQYREWSGDLIAVGEAALHAVLQRIMNSITSEMSDNNTVQWIGRGDATALGRSSRLAFKLRETKVRDQPQGEVDPTDRRWSLPIRPVLLGGDDLTFICDGRIALDLAAEAVRAIENQSVRWLGTTPIRACVGVAIVPYHSPFVRAYELAESLCQSAKRAARKGVDGTHNDDSFIDWHIGLPKPGQSVCELRDREYSALRANEPTPLKLTCRPYRLGSSAADAETWSWLDRTLLDDYDCGLRGELWSQRRNKAKELRELLSDGAEAIASALHRWRVVSPKLAFPTNCQDNGFFDLSRTPLLDALELLDLHLPLELASEMVLANEARS